VFTRSGLQIVFLIVACRTSRSSRWSCTKRRAPRPSTRKITSSHSSLAVHRETRGTSGLSRTRSRSCQTRSKPSSSAKFACYDSEEGTRSNSPSEEHKRLVHVYALTSPHVPDETLDLFLTQEALRRSCERFSRTRPSG
jgi:hypothetical protein